jgi:hypothetical protein
MSSAREDAPFTSDGTLWTDSEAPYQDPLFSDFTSEPDDGFSADTFRPTVTPPLAHSDVHRVREMVDDDALSEEDGTDPEFRYVRPQEFDPSQPPLGMLPQQQSWPARKVLKPRKGGKSKRSGKKLRDQIRQRPTGLLPSGKISTGTVGAIVAAILMIIFAIVAIAMLSSLFGMIGSVFQR